MKISLDAIENISEYNLGTQTFMDSIQQIEIYNIKSFTTSDEIKDGIDILHKHFNNLTKIYANL